jgi:hypothetical protein
LRNTKKSWIKYLFNQLYWWIYYLRLCYFDECIESYIKRTIIAININIKHVLSLDSMAEKCCTVVISMNIVNSKAIPLIIRIFNVPFFILSKLHIVLRVYNLNRIFFFWQEVPKFRVFIKGIFNFRKFYW